MDGDNKPHGGVEHVPLIEGLRDHPTEEAQLPF